jgi:CheY-like chemotaxis protein
MRAQKRVLVVDDNIDAAMILRMMLSRTGYAVQMAHDGLAAVQIAAEFNPDVVLLDIGLPKLNGNDACRQIRSLPNGDKMVIIAVTGWGQHDTGQHTDDPGFTKHLVKPIDLATLEQFLMQQA